jgi:hypothetical protein
LKAIANLLLRLFYLVALSIWVGGFTFYGAVVIPVLHDHLGSPLDVGLITRQVTDVLNVIGGTTLVAGWLLTRSQRRSGTDGSRVDRRWYGSLGVSTVCLAVLLALHAVMDRKLETGRLAGFYSWHRAYLWISMVQWLANLALLAQCAGTLTPVRGSDP